MSKIDYTATWKRLGRQRWLLTIESAEEREERRIAAERLQGWAQQYAAAANAATYLPSGYYGLAAQQAGSCPHCGHAYHQLGSLDMGYLGGIGSLFGFRGLG